MTEAALLVFAKVPEPGNVKTRLTTALSDAQAARLYTAMLADALEQYAALEHDVRLYLAGDAAGLPRDLVPPEVTLHAQRGRGLGARMQHALLESFAAGYEKLCLIGTDHPTLPTGFIRMAFDVLAQPLHVALGPTEDGGYYALATNDFFPSLFDGMTYSHADVFAQTLERASRAAAGVTVLPPWYDVDEPDDLERLADDLAETPPSVAPHTRACLRELQPEHL